MQVKITNEFLNARYRRAVTAKGHFPTYQAFQGRFSLIVHEVIRSEGGEPCLRLPGIWLLVRWLSAGLL